MVGKLATKHSCRAIRLWRAAVASFVVASMMLACLPLHAATCSWIATSGDWSNSLNWKQTTPTGSDAAYIAKGGTATVTMSGEVCSTLTVGGNAQNGTVLMSGGDLSTNAMKLGYNAGSIGTFVLSGGQLTASFQYVGETGGTGSLVQTGGTNAANDLYLGENASSSGTYSLSGTGQLTVSEEVIGENGGSGTFTQSGGVNTVTGDLILGDTPGSSGTYNLNGGILITSSIQSSGNSPAFNFNGGTLQASGGFTSNLPMRLGTSGGGAIFDTAGSDVTIAGALSGSGGLTKIGEGTLTLSASNSYSGGTIVSGGMLQLGVQAGVPDNTALTVTSGTLDLGGFTKTTTAAVSFQGGVVQNGVITHNGSSPYDGQAGTILASLQGTAGLNKTTSGILALTGSNSYTGDTQITAGTLEVDGPMTASTALVSIGPMSTLVANTSIPRAITGVAVGSQIVANAANVSLGDSTSTTGFNHAGTLTVGSNTVTLNSAGLANLGELTTLGGGALLARNGIAIPSGGSLNGSGTVNGRIAAGSGSTINATGNLTLGDSTSLVGFVSSGVLYTHANTVTLNSGNAVNNQNAVVLGSLTQIDGGRIIAPNGILLPNGNNLTTTDTGGTVSGGTAFSFLNGGLVQGPSSLSSNWLTFNLPFKGSTGQTSGRIAFLSGFATGDSPGVNSQYGPTLLGGTGTEIDIGGTTPGNSDNNYGQLNIATNPADLNNHGNLTFVPGTTIKFVDWKGFVPSVGDDFTVLTWDGTLSGSASLSIDPAFAAEGIRLIPVWNAHSLVLDTVHPATIGINAVGATIITGGTGVIGATVSNSAASPAANLNYALAANVSGGSAMLGSAIPASGSLAHGASQASTIMATSTNLGENTVTWTASDANSSNLIQTASATLTVLGHAAPSLSLVSGNSQTVILGATGIDAGLTLSNGTAGQSGLSSLDVNSLGSGVTGSIGGELVASGSSQSYVATFNTGTLGTQTQTFSLNAGDDHTLPGASAPINLSTSATLTVLGHTAANLSVVSGISQTVIIGATGIDASLKLSNGSAGQTGLASLDVNSLGTDVSGPIGSKLIGSGSSQSYTAALSTGTLGTQIQTFSLNAGDDHTMPGASAPINLSVSATLTVLGHTAPSLSVSTGNNQTVIEGAAGVSAGLYLSNGTSGQSGLASLDVNSLGQCVIGPIGGELVASGSSQSYTAALSSGTLGTQTQTFNLNVGDDHTLAGASVPTNVSTGITLTVLGHAAPSLSIISGNNQKVITGATGITAGLNLSNGSLNQSGLAPLDVDSLGSGVSGSTGGALVTSGSAQSYTAALSTSTLGLQTQTFSLSVGDDHTLPGATAPTNVSTSVMLTVLGHAAPSLNLVTGNSQTVIIGAAGISAGLSLSNGTSGQTGLASLDVNSLGGGVSGSTGSALIASGSSQSYTGLFNTGTMGTQTQTFSLNAGDDHTLPGESAPMNLSTSATLTVLGHSAPSLSVTSGINQTVIVGATGISAGLSLSNGRFGQPGLAALDVNSLGTSVSGPIGGKLIVSGSSQSYTAALNTGTLGTRVETFSMNVGDDNTLAGASAPINLSTSATLTVLDHSAGSLAVTSGNGFLAHAGTPFLAATVSLSNSAGTRSDLEVSSIATITSGTLGSGPATPYYITPGSAQAYQATFNVPGTPGPFSNTVTFTSVGDRQSLAGANLLGSLSVSITGNVYSGKAEWNTTTGLWATAANWKDTIGGGPSGPPGLTGYVTDTATFGTAAVGEGTAVVVLNGTAPVLSNLIFDNPNAGYWILQGAGTTGLTLTGTSGNSPAAITVIRGTHMVTAPIVFDHNLIVSSSGSITLAGSLSSDGLVRSLTLEGGGKLILAGTGSYTGGTFVDNGTLILASRNAIADGSSLTVGDGAESIFSATADVPLTELSTLVSTVPEPTMFALLVVGAIGLLGFACGRRPRR